jgi:glucosyl-3-phosphoglycerate synthase
MAEAIERVLVAGTSSQNLAAILPFARALADASAPVVIGLVAVPDGESLSAGALRARRLRETITLRAPDARVIARVAHDVWRELDKLIADEHASLLLLNAADMPTQEWMRALECDLAIVKPPCPKKIRRILLPIRGGPFAARALRIALSIADAHHSEITVLHAVPPTRRKNESYQQTLAHLRQLPQVTRWIHARGDVVATIQRAAPHHQLLVMGSIARPRPDDPAIGPTATRALAEVPLAALVVKAPREISGLNGAPPQPERAPVDYTISVVVDKWFAENTFHASEFQNVRDLVKLKEQQGLAISLGLPTLNEEKTIGKIIKMMRRQFMTEHPLLDEIVVIDSNSTDRTVAIAESMGVPVVKHSNVLTQYKAWAGKGEALWKSLHVLRGDLIAWIDTDIVNIHPRFVYGILGPLLREPRLMYVKGFYQRPLRMGKQFQARGGGRVTELVARPLLNLFYPELSGFVQPLSGEYAGRRAALEAVPFFEGYGVEIGLLIDLWSRCGLAALGQVDLEQRIHRNQSLGALSKMAFEIIQVVMTRVGKQHNAQLLNELNSSLKLIRYTRDEFRLDVADVRARERKPMIEIPEYRAMRVGK